MNYFAHGRRFVDDPYFLAGTAIPDLMNVADRGVRVRRRHAAPFANAEDAHLASVARGIVQHHADDGWFHETLAFHESCLFLTRLARQVLPADEGFRPSFLGHILVEILLDAELIAQSPSTLESYYGALDSVDGERLQQVINTLSPRPTQRLAGLFPLFCRERFLWDYADDGKLWGRLNQVMRRVQLPLLPETIRDILPAARVHVTQQRERLLTP